ncbi:hypothetical protein MPTK1_2g09120 [Marchantia polymorpha subsp. ruderalis]|uniref:Uncharacterized protein n=1 Tax=Marchantia polymorpha TaxID=3197 RepID=A0A2R6XH30_MARPO|nr:hypothetical protein MARPO_0015s0195 [Marchantia polymorpha]PTQ45416.1 hypothetical protein MARPO_0015s0195 [Marchantia polymorpha]BBN01649.1 hypothetical protein Mp_2g09120 [Marchantia polymorpha subsp. ruderalis]BBN01650.1 hypothetical protein Mp_2g09120 [Marchantia polymorpha subsp. ruderalis]|eukprot:PTQ45415.1 hypothetical protein MARPO_0015s0195 [Marchantia polymorpha]
MSSCATRWHMLGLSNVHGAFRQYLVRNRSFTTSGFPTDTMVPITDFVLFHVENIGQRGRLGFHAPRRYLLVCQVFVRNNGKLAYNGVNPMLTEKSVSIFVTYPRSIIIERQGMIRISRCSSQTLHRLRFSCITPGMRARTKLRPVHLRFLSYHTFLLEEKLE